MKTYVLCADPENCDVIARRLRSRGHDATLGSVPPDGRPDGDDGEPVLVVVDVRRTGADPGVDAVAPLRELGARPDRGRLFVVAVAAPTEFEAAVSSGADDLVPADADDALWDARLALSERRALEAFAHRRSDEALADSLANLEALIENVQDFVLFSDRTASPVYFNSAYARAIRAHVGIEMRPGVKPHESLPDPAERRVWDEFHRRVLSGEHFTETFVHRRPDGTRRSFEVSYNPVLRDGAIVGFSEFTRDVTEQAQAAEALHAAHDQLERKVAERTADLERSNRALQQEVASRKAAEDARRESEELYSRIFETAPVAIVVWDAARRIMGWNPHAERIFGWSNAESLGCDFLELVIPKRSRPRLRRDVALLLDGRGTRRGVYKNVTKSGGEVVCDWSNVVLRDQEGRVVGAISIGIDVTEQRALEQRLRQSEKLESIGQLAGGVAHDINNQLVGIKGFADLLSERMAGQSPVAEWSSGILRSAGRAADLVAKLLAFARRRTLADEPVDLHDVVHEVIALLERSIDKRIVIERDLAAPRAVVHGDPTQLHGALLNLALNARDAMPEGGTLRFASAVVPAMRTDDSDASEAPRPAIRLTVRDTGVGMDEQTRARIFEPFFTTKPTGTGMGLAAVYGTVHSHGGRIGVRSEPGAGTEFELSLPLHDGPRRAPVDRSESPHGGSRPLRVLVIDDEETVREVFTAMLRRLGHDVTTCADGDLGVARFRSAPHDFDLVIVDVTMPRMTGFDVLAEIQAIAPDVRAILTSGYAEEDAGPPPAAVGVQAFLAKPFDMPTLAARIRTALEA